MTETTTQTTPTAPKHLSTESQAWYEEVATSFALDSHHRMLLQGACESWDRMQCASLAIAEAGLTFNDRFGQPHARPEVAIEKNSKSAFVRILRELRLDESSPETLRLPRNRRG